MFIICSYLSAAYPKAATRGHDTSYSSLIWWRLIHKTADYSERWLNGERISFVESTVNRVVSRRFAKKQQMQWSKQGAHLLLQTRTKALDGTLRDLFTRWYPAMAANDNQVAALAMAA